MADPFGSGFWAAFGYWLGSRGDIWAAPVVGLIVGLLAVLLNARARQREAEKKATSRPPALKERTNRLAGRRGGVNSTGR